MLYRRLQTQAKELSREKALLDEILAPIDFSDFSILNLVERVAAVRGRPIELCPRTMPDLTQYGAWIASPSYDFIFFERDTARIHQDHIICHELAHMLLGHQTLVVPEALPVSAQVLMRQMADLHKSPRERDAEEMATLIQNELIRRAGLQALTARIATAPLWSSLVFGLGLDR
jgi:hypothetical protein